MPNRGQDLCRRFHTGRRDGGFVTPVGWVFLTALLVVIVLVVATIVWVIGSANVAVAENVAELVATQGASLGLQYLIAAPTAGGATPAISLPEPDRTNAVLAYISVHGELSETLARYRAPFQVGDLVVSVVPTDPIAVAVTMTGRAGKSGQFVRTVTRSASVAAANSVDAGQLIHRGETKAPVAGGVLPLAIDLSALDTATYGGQPGAGSGLTDNLVPVQLGKTAFAVVGSGGSGGDETSPGGAGAASESAMLLAAAEFLSFDGSGTPGGAAPPAFAVGQQLRLARARPAKKSAQGRREQQEEGVAVEVAATEASTDTGVTSMSDASKLAEALLARLEGRAVIVPLMRADLVQGFAVARVRRPPSGGLSLELLPSSITPLARFDAQVDSVPEGLSSMGGLAMGLTMPEFSDEAQETEHLGEMEALG